MPTENIELTEKELQELVFLIQRGYLYGRIDKPNGIRITFRLTVNKKNTNT